MPQPGLRRFVSQRRHALPQRARLSHCGDVLPPDREKPAGYFLPTQFLQRLARVGQAGQKLRINLSETLQAQNNLGPFLGEIADRIVCSVVEQKRFPLAIERDEFFLRSSLLARMPIERRFGFSEHLGRRRQLFCPSRAKHFLDNPQSRLFPFICHSEILKGAMVIVKFPR